MADPQLFIEQMLDLGKTKGAVAPQYPAGVIDIECPFSEVDDKKGPIKNSRSVTRALLDGDIQFSFGNKWGNLIDLGTTISDWQQALNLGDHNLLHWVSASSAGWKGAEPLTITFSCYLITYKPGQISIKEQAKALIELASLYVNTQGSAVTQQATVKVHGGYEPKYFAGNAELIGDLTVNANLGKGINLGTKVIKDMYNGVAEDGNTGLINIQWGGAEGPRISGLLLEKCETQISSVMCAPGVPLWIKLTPTLRTYRSMTTADVGKLFGVRG